jgi:DNA-binding transcriptional MerR regulator
MSEQVHASTMTIGEVARHAEVTAETIRFYERERLLPEPERTHTGYRIYEPWILGRLRFLKRARYLGLSLDEIREVVGMSKSGRAPCCRVRELLADKLRELDRTIADLKQFRSELNGFIASVAGLPDQADASESVCALIEIAPLGRDRPPSPDRKISRKRHGRSK